MQLPSLFLVRNIIKIMWLRCDVGQLLFSLFPPHAISGLTPEVILSFQGFMIVDRSALYGSRNMVDQHREMRLDVDNMSYEVIINIPS